VISGAALGSDGSEGAREGSVAGRDSAGLTVLVFTRLPRRASSILLTSSPPTLTPGVEVGAGVGLLGWDSMDEPSVGNPGELVGAVDALDADTAVATPSAVTVTFQLPESLWHAQHSFAFGTA
jgi:hypothetical protein